MNILLVCAGGYSTSILMNKVMKYAKQNNLDIKIEAHGASLEDITASDFDVVLLAPQVRFKKDEIEKKTALPVIQIPPMDYGAGKPERIIELAQNGLKASKGE
jgi:PTS system cellobiose-specific IIB component